MKILLTGPTGFVGTAFTRLAQSQGHEVAGLVIPAEPLPAPLPGARPVLWLRGTLEEAPWDEISRFGPEVCLHTAWITTPGVYLEAPENEKFRDASAAFLTRVRELGTSYIFSLGTCIEYQITNAPLTEDRTPIAPTTKYARCKNELRLVLEEAAKREGFGFCWGRVFYPYGPGEHPSRLCSSIIRQLAKGEKVLLKTPASTKDYIFIQDLAGALLRVLERRFAGAINLGTGSGVSVREIADELARLLGRPELIEEAVPPHPDPFPLVLADAGKLKSLGWRPEFTMAAGLEQTARSLGALPRSAQKSPHD